MLRIMRLTRLYGRDNENMPQPILSLLCLDARYYLKSSEFCEAHFAVVSLSSSWHYRKLRNHRGAEDG